MKIFGIVVGVLFIIFLVIQFFVYKSRSTIESYPYIVGKDYTDFEIRNYEASLFTSVKLETDDYKSASSKGFSILGGYIFGNNDKDERISMTSPVAMSLKDSITMMFMVPKRLTIKDLPRPNQSEIKFIEEPAKTVAAISFGGWANTDKIEKYKKKIISALENENILFKDQFYLLGYNPPYDMIGRRNEIIVELK
jgi:hypothetical protein